MNHLAASFEDHALVDAQTRRENITSEDRGPMNFDPMLGAHGTVNLTADDHGSGFDLSLYSSALTYDQCIGGKNLAAKSAANSNRTLEAEFPFEFAAMIDHPGYSGV